MSAVGLAACGIVAPIIYTGTVALGGYWRGGDYSHKARAISELTERGAPNKAILDGFFVVYNILMMLGAGGIYQATSYMGGNFYSGAALLVAATVLSILMTIFPMDPMSRENATPSSRSGQIHIGAAAIVSFLTMISMGLFANAGINTVRFNSWGIFTAVSLVIVVLAGIASTVAAVRLHPMMGMLERITIGMFLAWFFVTCCMVANFYFPS